MEYLKSLLHELGISKVKLAKYLGVSRQMIYNYLDMEDINNWPTDKKVLLFNLFGVKSSEEMKQIKITTDYIDEVEMRLSSLENTNKYVSGSDLLVGFDNKSKETFLGICDLLKEYMDEDNKVGEYFHHYLQAMQNTKELKYILGYIAKETGFVKPMEFVFNEEEQFIFESIMHSAMVLYRSGKASKNKLAESHRRFVSEIEQKQEDKLSRTMELNSIKNQALKELGYTEINEHNAGEIFAKIAEIQSRKTAFKKDLEAV